MITGAHENYSTTSPAPVWAWLINKMDDDSCSEYKDQFKLAHNKIDNSRKELIQIGASIWAKPELCYEEYEAHRILTDYLEKEGFNVERGYCGISTSFRARFGSGHPNVCIPCEYDALPEIGHACGHNLIAESSVAAAIGVKAFLEAQKTGFQGSLTVIGTPAEEGGGGKILLLEKNGFEDVDIALMLHPGPYAVIMPTLISFCGFKVTFKGKAAHAAAFPWEGINALDAAVLAYNNVSVLRQQMKPSWRVHGIISNGGAKPNIIPKEATMEYRVRAVTSEEVLLLKKKVIECFNAAAKATGCSLTVSDTELLYEDLRSNEALAAIYAKQLETLGIKGTPKYYDVMASSDMGNLSYVVPTIHPGYSIGTGKEFNHNPEFTSVSNTASAHKETLLVSKALAMTSIEVILRGDEAMADIRREFEALKAASCKQ